MAQRRFSHLPNPTSTLPPVYVQNLERCVEKLQNSSLLLQTSVKRLEYGTKDFTRINEVLKYDREHELVTEKDINDAQINLAAEISPEINSLINQIEKELTILQQREHQLQTEVDSHEIELGALRLPKPRGNETLHAKRGTKKSKLSPQPQQERDVKELKAQRMKLTASVENLTEQIWNKELELRTLKRRSCIMEQPSSSTYIDPKLEDSVLVKMESFQKQLNELDTAIQEKQLQVDLQQKDTLGCDSIHSEESEEETCWNLYAKQLDFFKAAQQRSQLISILDDEASELETLSNLYFEEAHLKLSEIRETLPSLEERRNINIENMKNLASLLYPDSLGSTIGRVVEILLESKFKEIQVRELSEDFPPLQERRHRLHTAISLLNEYSITETVFEEDLDAKDGEGRLLLKIKLDEDD